MMMKTSRGRARALPIAAYGAAVVFGLAVSAQAAAAQTPVSTVYEREVFTYPSLGRRDPFRPLNAGDQIGPRFSDLNLTGVLYNPAIGSVATLLDEKSGRRYRSREGDVLGDIRIAAIRIDEVDFVITSFGISRRETLTVKKTKEIDG